MIFRQRGISEVTGLPYKTYSKQITLKEEFKWFLEEEFDKLRQGFVATGNRAYMNLDGTRTRTRTKRRKPRRKRRLRRGDRVYKIGRVLSPIFISGLCMRS
jgi:hypothetical protein